MPHQENQVVRSGNDNMNGDDHRSSNLHQPQSRKSSQQSVMAGNKSIDMDQGGPVQPPAENANYGITSAAQPLRVALAPGEKKVIRLRTTPYTAGFKRVMDEYNAKVKNEFLPAPTGTVHPVRNGISVTAPRSVSASVVQGGPVSSLSSPVNTSTISLPELLNSAKNTEKQAAPVYATSSPVETPLTPLFSPTIHERIENAVESQVAEALAPLRFIAGKLSDAVRAIAQENSDFHEQNNTLSRQLDLQYGQIQQQAEHATAHVRALLNLIEAQSSIKHNGANAMGDANAHMTQMVTALPGYLGTVLHRSVLQLTEHSTIAMQQALQPTLQSLQHNARIVQHAVQSVQGTVQQTLEQSLAKTVQQVVQQNFQQAIQYTIQQTIHRTHQQTLRQSSEVIQKTVQQTIQQNVEKAVHQALDGAAQTAIQDALNKTVQVPVQPRGERVSIPGETVPILEQIVVSHHEAIASHHEALFFTEHGTVSSNFSFGPQSLYDSCCSSESLVTGAIGHDCNADDTSGKGLDMNGFRTSLPADGCTNSDGDVAKEMTALVAKPGGQRRNKIKSVFKKVFTLLRK